MADQPATPVIVRKGEESWVDQGPGSTYAVLNFCAERGLTTLTRFAAGTIGAWHGHPGGEELFVIEGKLTVGGERLKAGDYMFTPPGGRHRVEAHSDVLLFVQLPQLPVYDNDGGEAQ